MQTMKTFAHRCDDALRRCADDGWVTVEGEFSAIMAVVMPCRSDRSDSGLSPFAHMADGRIHLILVRKCSTLQYLKFLASIPRSGVLPENFDYVEAVDAVAMRVEPEGARTSCLISSEFCSTPFS